MRQTALTPVRLAETGRHAVRRTLIGSLRLAALGCAVFAVRPAVAQDSAAFQNATTQAQNSPRGTCRSIPYPDLQDACVRKQAEVDKWCEEWSCKGMDPAEAQKNLERLKTALDETQTGKADLERQASSLTDTTAKRVAEDSVKALDARIAAIERQRDSIAEEVKAAARQTSDQLDRGKACRDYRVSVNDVYREARSRAGSERDPTIAPLAAQLVTIWDGTL